MKGLVAKELKDMKEKEGYYSLKVALDNVLKNKRWRKKLAPNRIDNVTAWHKRLVLKTNWSSSC